MSYLQGHIGRFFEARGIKINGIHTKVEGAADIGFNTVTYHYAAFFFGTGQVKGMFKNGFIGFVYTHHFGDDDIYKILFQIRLPDLHFGRFQKTVRN